MATWVNFCRTQQGFALDTKVSSGVTSLKITKAMSAAGRVNPLLLKEQSALTDERQVLELMDIQTTEDPTEFVLPIKLLNKGIGKKYSMYQLGIFADDPDSGEILYMICQTSTEEGEEIPSEAEQPGFTIQWNYKIKTADVSQVTVEVTEVGLLTIDEANRLYVNKEAFEEYSRADIDCGIWSEVSQVALHNLSAHTHLNLNVDGNTDSLDMVCSDDDLSEHVVNPNAHPNLNIDGNDN